MAHFAELDNYDKVINVIVLDDSVLLDENGIELEEKGINFLTELTGHSRWVKTSMNNKIRKRYAGIGMIYDRQRNAFYYEKPEENPSYIFNENTCQWEPPIKMPESNEFRYFWNEDTQAWVQDTSYKFNTETNSWDRI